MKSRCKNANVASADAVAAPHRLLYLSAAIVASIMAEIENNVGKVLPTNKSIGHSGPLASRKSMGLEFACSMISDERARLAIKKSWSVGSVLSIQYAGVFFSIMPDPLSAPLVPRRQGDLSDRPLATQCPASNPAILQPAAGRCSNHRNTPGQLDYFGYAFSPFTRRKSDITSSIARRPRRLDKPFLPRGSRLAALVANDL